MTYGTNAPRGFQPYNTGNGAGFTGVLTEYPLSTGVTNTIFNGDPVSLSTAGVIDRATASTAVLGVFYGCKYRTAAGDSAGQLAYAYWPGAPTIVAGTTPVALVQDDPRSRFTIQETDAGSASGTPLTQAAAGNNCNFLYTAGSVVTGQSAVSLNNAASATTLVGNCKIVGLDPRAGNAAGAFANWIVEFNNDVFKAGSTRP